MMLHHGLCPHWYCLKLPKTSDYPRRKPFLMIVLSSTLPARSLSLTPAHRGQYIHRRLPKWKSNAVTCQSGLPFPPTISFVPCYIQWGSRDSLLVKAPDSWSKGCEFESRQKRREKFLLQCQLCALTLIRCPFHPSVTAVARKRPRSFCQKCRWEITPKHARIFDQTKSEWADHAAIQAEYGNELTRNSSGNTLSQSSQVAKPLWTDPVLKSGTSLRKLISA